MIKTGLDSGPNTEETSQIAAATHFQFVQDTQVMTVDGGSNQIGPVLKMALFIIL